MNINQIYSYFPLKYPDRLIDNSTSINKKKEIFVIQHLNNEDKWYKIPFEKEKNIIISNYHWNNNHCGRDAVIYYIKSNRWYWYGFFKDIDNIIILDQNQDI